MERVILFFRRPRPGVKSRLAATVGDVAAARLYEAILHDLRERIEPARRVLLPMIDDPGVRSPWSRSLLQSGETLGERMQRAFELVLSAGAARALLFGSDVPGIDARLLGEAFEKLRRDDAVIGPSRDGGYYLIGFTPRGFEAARRSHALYCADRGSDAVCELTVGALESRSTRVARIATQIDLDTETDLRSLLSDTQLPAPRLRRLASELGL